MDLAALSVLFSTKKRQKKEEEEEERRRPVGVVHLLVAVCVYQGNGWLLERKEREVRKHERQDAAHTHPVVSELCPGI